MLRALEGALSSRAVPSERCPRALADLKAQLLPQCPQLASWGWRSSRQRLVDAQGLQQLALHVAHAAGLNASSAWVPRLRLSPVLLPCCRPLGRRRRGSV